MKQQKILLDLIPRILEIGYEVEIKYQKDGALDYIVKDCYGNGIMIITIYEKEDIVKAKKIFEELAQNEMHKPKIGDKYYFIKENGKVEVNLWINSYCDYERFRLGNCFETEVSASIAKGRIREVLTQHHKENAIKNQNDFE